MTDEELKQKAEDSLSKRMGTIGYLKRDNVDKPYTDGYIAGAMENGTQWHSVADGDLPEEYTEVLNDDGVKVELRDKHWRYVYGGAWEDDACVEHWCEIPVF